MEIISLILSAALLILGGLIAIVNNWILIQQLRGIHSPSVVPFFGGILLMIGLFVFPYYDLKYWPLLALMFDYRCVPYTLGAICYLFIDAYRTSNFNLVHQFTYKQKEKNVRIRLFKKSIANIVFILGSTTVSRSCSWEKDSKEIIVIDCGDSSYRLQLASNEVTFLSEEVNDTAYSLEGMTFYAGIKG